MTNKAIRNGSQVWFGAQHIGTVVGKVDDTLLRIRCRDGKTIKARTEDCNFSNPEGRKHNGRKMIVD
jgi:hypothetical protein